jgi:hypothetical protein
MRVNCTKSYITNGKTSRWILNECYTGHLKHEYNFYVRLCRLHIQTVRFLAFQKLNSWVTKEIFKAKEEGYVNGVHFTDEASFHINHHVNRHKRRIWEAEQPHTTWCFWAHVWHSQSEPVVRTSVFRICTNFWPSTQQWIILTIQMYVLCSFLLSLHIVWHSFSVTVVFYSDELIRSPDDDPKGSKHVVTIKNYVKHTPALLILFTVVLTVRNSYIYGIHNRMQIIKICCMTVR